MSDMQLRMLQRAAQAAPTAENVVAFVKASRRVGKHVRLKSRSNNTCRSFGIVVRRQGQHFVVYHKGIRCRHQHQSIKNAHRCAKRKLYQLVMQSDDLMVKHVVLRGAQ